MSRSGSAGATRTRTLDDELVWPRREPGAGARVGRYRIRGRLGAGAMGVVHEAWDERLHRRVAVKVLHPTRHGRAEERRRVRREARAMATVSHPGVVPVYDVGEHEGLLYVVMELVDATDLRQWLQGQPSIEARLRVLTTAGEGLAAAHQAGLVHRDIKPSNILVTPQGTGRVTDFGLAVGPAIVDAAESRTRAVGTPAYMAPEQFEGRTVDARADQYAFCVTAWETLTGQRPFEASGMMALAEAKLAGPPSLAVDRDVPRAVRSAIARGLQPDPRERWPSMSALLSALTSTRRPRRPRLVAATAVGAVAIGVAWPAADPCAPGLEPLREAWTPERRAQVELVLRTDIGRAPAQRVVADLDDRVRAWSGAYREACGAGSPVATQIDPRVRCLVRVRRELVAWLDVFDDSPGRALRALPSVASADECDDVDTSAATVVDPGLYDEIEEALSQGWGARVRGHFADAERILDDAARRAREAGHDEQVATALRRLGSVQDTRGRPEAARQSLLEAIEIAERLGSDRLLAESYVELAWVQTALGRLDEAERSQRAAAAAITRIGGDHRLEAARLTNVAGLRSTQGRDDEGVEALQQASALWTEETENMRLRDTAMSSIEKNLAVFAMGRGEIDEAKGLLESARARLVDRYGEEHPDVAELDIDLSVIFDAMGDTAQARRHAERARRVLRDELGPDHPWIARAEVMLAYCANADDDIGRAAAHLQRAADIRVAVYGEDDVVAWGHRVNLARMKFDLGDISGAAELAQRAKLAIGDAHPPTPSSLASLMTSALIASATGETEMALVDLERALAALDLVYPPEHPRRADNLETIADTFEEAGAPERAAQVRAELDAAAPTE